MSRSALQLAIDKAGAALWPFVPRRDGPVAVPVAVIVPGIMGSALSADGEQVWISPWRLVGGGLQRLRYPDEGRNVEAGQVLCFAYRRLAEKLSEAGFQVVGQPYDWRLELEPAAELLNLTLRGLLDSDAPELADAPIHIVAHSMGGLVTRWAQHLDPDLFARLAARGEVVFLGTPGRGSFAAPLALTGEYPPIRMLATLDVRSSKNDVLEIVSNFAGMTQLLPAPALLDDHIRNHLYDAESWVPHGEETASNLKTALRQHAVMEDLDNAHLHIVLGDGLETPVAVDIAHGELQFRLAPAGDGTVSVECGTIEGVRSTYYAHRIGHGDLVKDPKALQGVVDLLATGSTKQFLSSRVTRGAEAEWAAEGPLVSATETGDRLSRATMRSTRGAAPGLRAGVPTSRAAAQQIVADGMGVLFPAAVADGPAIVDVEIVHGDLEAARHPLMLGHATGTPISGAETRVDQLLDGELTRLQEVGLLPDRPDEFRWLPRTDDYQQLRGAVVVALDSRQPLTPLQITGIVRAAAIDFVDRTTDSVQMNALPPSEPLGLSAVAIGSGPVFGLAPERSVLAIVKGVLEANEVLAAAGERTIEQVQFVERYATKAERLHWALRRVAHDAEESVGQLQIDVPSTVSARDGGMPGSPSPRYDSGRWERLIVRPDDEHSAPGSLALKYQYATNRAAVSDESRRVDRSVITQRVRTAVADPATTQDQGIALYEELLPFELKEELSQSDNLVLLIDASTADVPWEMLVDRNRSGQPLATSMGLLRQFSDEGLRPATRWHHDRGALVIGDPPTNLPPLPGAREEARDVADILADAGVTPDTILVPSEDRHRSAADIKQALNAHAYQIVHIASHGLYKLGEREKSSGADRPEIIGGVAIGPDAYLTADDFKNLRVPPDLVFLNCCHLGRIEPVGDHKLLGRDQGDAAASIARQLMRIGVKAVVVAGWAVNDAIAHAFARRLYDNLAVRGLQLGAAVREAREGALSSSAADNTWAAYQVYGDPEFRLRDARYRVEPSSTPQLPLVPVAERRLAEISSDIREHEADAPIGDLLRRTEELDQAIETTWPADGKLLALRGRAWSDLGEFPRAIALYERASSMSDGAAPTWVADQHFNLLSRYAAALYRGDTFGRPADELPAPRSLMNEARRNEVVLERLGLNAERHALIGGFHKRQGAIGTAARKPGRCIEAALAYLAALEAKANSYHLCNYLQLAALAAIHDPDSAGDWRVESDWLDSLSDAATGDPSVGDYWTRIGVGDANLTVAVLAHADALVSLLRGEVDGGHAIWGLLDDPPEWKSIADVYTKIRQAGGRRREQLSTIDHISDLVDLLPVDSLFQQELRKLAAGLRSPARLRSAPGLA